VLGELEIDKVYTEEEIAAYVQENYGIDILNEGEYNVPLGGYNADFANPDGL
jgi:hypothetical protein